MSAGRRRRVLLLVPSTTYRIGDFLAAAERLEIDVAVGSDQRHVLDDAAQGRTVALDFRDLDDGVARIADFHEAHPLAAIVGIDEETTLLAAAAAAALGLPHNPPDAVRAAGNKHRFRARLANSGLAVPRFSLLGADEDPGRAAAGSFYPAVLKPLANSGGRGVIRVDDAGGFVAAVERIRRILADSNAEGEAAAHVLVEEYIAGDEVALEGLLDAGALTVLALFDKPDPMEGPFFEETIYVTPSRLPADLQDAVADAVGRTTAALGLAHGPIHAEARVRDGRVWVIEVAARSIGGLCARSLRFGTGVGLEDLILTHALGRTPASTERQAAAAGVMMIPIPRSGVLRRVEGLDAARAVPRIEEIVLSVPMGSTIVPLPEGDRYLGFIFARGSTPDAVETALREAHGRLGFVVEAPQAR